ncbi:MAG TPA: transglutaminase domain-containing protein [Thermoanaerobaculia bacterium]|nr:transglutaminase domain-containing protein [Thermoanaerobaculia bacterium]
MNRRTFLKSTGAISASLALPGTRRLLALGETRADGWRVFEVTTRVEVLKPSGTTLVWLPTPLLDETPFQKTLASDFHAEGGSAELVRKPEDALGIVAAKFPDGVRPVLTSTCRVATRDYSVDLSAPGKAPRVDSAELEYFRQASKMIPIDGAVKVLALDVTRGQSTDVEKARAIYEWIADKTYRNPKTRGCGVGDIRFLVESKDFGGKCADLNALYVGLARAAGLPARDVYGIRIGPSALGYKSLGLSSDNATKAQHCRAQVHLRDYGWVPVDPADVRKVVLEEPPGNLPIDDPKVQKARVRLFGSWEMNWMAYNYGHDVALPGTQGAPCNFLMYPQCETADGRLDPLDADDFRYQITAKEITAA